MKKIAILQSNYIPWKGYFDLIAAVDEFIVYDEVQYTKNDWRNRNKIKTRDGLQWLTIPVLHNTRFGQRIDEVVVSDPRWSRKHRQALLTQYAKAPFFGALFPQLDALYETCQGLERLSDINMLFLRWVHGLLGLDTVLRSSTDYPSDGDRNVRLLHICRLAGAQAYLSGPAARCYLDVPLFQQHGIEVEWMDYGGYPAYPQLHGEPFCHDVTVLDLLFNVGPQAAREFMKFPALRGGE